MACGAAARFRLDEICSVAVDVEAHVASVEPDDGAQLCCCVVHERFCLLDGVGGGKSFFGTNSIERNEYCGVDGESVVEEVAGDALHTCDAAFSSFGAAVALGEYCTLDPYVGASHLWGECWGRGGMGCWKYSRDLRTELGMEMLT